MKVLHVIESLGVGGAETLLVNLLPELQSQGDEVTLAVMRGPFDLRPSLEAQMTQATDRQNTDHGATHGGPRRGRAAPA